MTWNSANLQMKPSLNVVGSGEMLTTHKRAASENHKHRPFFALYRTDPLLPLIFIGWKIVKA